MKKLSAFLLMMLLFGSNGMLLAQDAGDENILMQCIERYYGTNDLLINGRPYLAVNTKASGHPYYGNEDFNKGVLYIKNQPFDNVDIKYNIEKGQVILHAKLTNTIPVQVIVTPALVDSFRINSQLFINKHIISREIPGPDYVKQLYAGQLDFYESRLKLYHPNFTQLHPFGRYGDPEITYILLSEEGWVDIKNKKAFLDYFGEHKRAVKRFMKQQSIKFRKASDSQFYKLMKYCDEL